MAESGSVGLVLLGASTRAAAFSARRAGLEPTCADLFGDRDLTSWCPVVRIAGPEYPGGLAAAALRAPPGPWMYTGALENHPRLIARIAASRPLWGNGPDVVRRVRDPNQLADCLARTGLPHPEVRASADGLPCDGTWLIKPRAGAGGRGIRELAGDVAAEPMNDGRQRPGTQYSVLSTRQSSATADRPARYYLQRRIEGLPCSAVFIGNGRRAAFVGVTQQLVGDPAFHARPFHYCGSIGPVHLPDDTRDNLLAVADALATGFGLRGLFGVDGVLRDGVFWPVEVNPRYTASVEVIEHALGLPLIAIHRDACLKSTIPALPASGTAVASRVPVLGKAILFAPAEQFTSDFTDRMHQTVDWPGRWPVPRIADVPRPGTKLAAGSPVLTVFASHDSFADCRDQLVAVASALYAELSAGACRAST